MPPNMSPLRGLLIGACLACAVALSACGAKQDVLAAPSTKPFTVILDFFPNADHAALYSAIDHGDFRAVGLDVKLVTPATPSEPLSDLAAGRADMAISYEPELLLARDKGMKLVSIAALTQRPLTSIISVSRSVHSVADLAGKRVGTAGIPYQSAELNAALAHAGVSIPSVKVSDVGFDLVQAMLSAHVDATIGGFWNYEAIQLRLMHRRPTVIPVDQAGVPNNQELNLVVREGDARSRGQDLRAFLQALTRGEREVRAQPAQAAADVLAANPTLPRALQLESIKDTLPAAVPSEAGKPFGWQSPGEWAAFSTWMFTQGLLTHNPADAGLPPFTNEFLPGQGI
jgi:putative hydroxymethylpyrimidine transport system substrate-binding protein